MQVKSVVDYGLVALKSGELGVARGYLSRCRIACLTIIYLLLITGSNAAAALGLGAADAQSYIGEPVKIKVPIFNVSDPDSLQVKLSSESALVWSNLQAEVDRSNSQLAVKIISDQRFNEPYLDFTLDLMDDGNAYSKEFTVLLDLAPAVADSAEADRVSALTGHSSTREIHSQNIAPAPNGSVLGPYQWAQKGNIPDQFGAVIDGQSLWRVARRINAAMDVSLNQMMWALYQENPHAFTSDSISSLQAGSYLRIPSRQQVVQYSDAQAKAELEKPTLTRVATQPAAAAPTRSAISSNSELSQATGSGIASSGETNTSPDKPAFDVTGLASNPQQTQGAGTDQSQVIISSLAQTVGNLTQELISKDKQISFLEEKVAALESYAGIDSEALAKQRIEQPDSPSESVSQDTTAAATTAAVPNNDAEIESRWTLGQALGFAAVLVLIAGFIFRLRLAELWSSLNFFSNNDDLGFDSASPRVDRDFDQARVDKPRKDYSVLQAVDHPEQEIEALEGISYLSLEDDGNYVESAVEPDSMVIIDDDADLSFAERFDRLLQEKDYEFARELLDFARYNEIDDQLYHCDRLRLFKAMDDEDGFYEYYYEIEAKIPQFAPHLQTQISQLVVQLAHH